MSSIVSTAFVSTRFKYFNRIIYSYHSTTFLYNITEKISIIQDLLICIIFFTCVCSTTDCTLILSKCSHQTIRLKCLNIFIFVSVLGKEQGIFSLVIITDSFTTYTVTYHIFMLNIHKHLDSQGRWVWIRKIHDLFLATLLSTFFSLSHLWYSLRHLFKEVPLFIPASPKKLLHRIEAAEALTLCRLSYLMNPSFSFPVQSNLHITATQEHLSTTKTKRLLPG